MIAGGTWKRVVVSSNYLVVKWIRVRSSAFADAHGAYHLYLKVPEGVGRGVCERARVLLFMHVEDGRVENVLIR